MLKLSKKSISGIKTFLKTFIGLPLTIISFYFIFSIIIRNKENVLHSLKSGNILVLVIGCFFLFLFFLIKAILWWKLLKENNFNTDINEGLYNYSLSEIKRYIPGNIFSFIARTSSFNSMGVPVKKTVYFLFIEAFLLTLASTIFMPLSLSFIKNGVIDKLYLNIQIVIVVVAAVLFLITTLTLVLLKIKNITLPIQKITPFVVGKLGCLKRKIYFDLFLMYVLAWFFFGLGNFFILSSFVYIDMKIFLHLLSFFIVSWLIGYLSFVTPMGLGVRETILAVGLSSIIPLHFSVAISVILRIFLIFSELFFVFLSFIFWRIKCLKHVFDYIVLNYQTVILSSAIISYSVYFTYATFTKHINFFTGRFDLGNMDQTVWNTINGRVFLLTNPDGTNIMSRLGIHSDFILIILSPLYILWSDPRMLLLIQTLVIASGALFLYLLSNKVLNNKNISLLLSISYLLNPFIQKQNLFDFHPVSLATTFLIASFYYLYLKKYKVFLIFLLLSTMTKENVFLVSSIFGLYILITNNKGKIQNLYKYKTTPNKLSFIFLSFKDFILNKNNLLGMILFLISFAAFYLLVAKFIPEARGDSHFALSYYKNFGDDTFDLIKNIFLVPNKIISVFFSIDSFNYIKKILLPVGYLPLLSPAYLAFTIPDFIINLASSNQNLRSIHYHYMALITPFVYISSIFGIKRILKNNSRFLTNLIIYYLIFFALLGTFQYGSLPGSQNPALEIYNKKKENAGQISAFLKRIPDGLSIASTNNLGSHLSQRQKIYTLPIGIKEADVVLFLIDNILENPNKGNNVGYSSIINNYNYVSVFKTKNFVVFIRKTVLDEHPSIISDLKKEGNI